MTDGARRDWSPVWSADSRELSFLSDRGSTQDLWRYVLGADGLPKGAPQQLTSGLEMREIAFSPNGKKLAYSKFRRVRNIYRAPILKDRPAAWTDVKQLTFDEADFESLDVSRDGRLVASSDRNGNWDIWTMSINGGELQQLTRDPAVDAGPRWKSDGAEIVFYSSRPGHREIFVMPAGGGAARQLTHGESEKAYPAWSPDGLKIAISAAGLPVINANGSGERFLTKLDVTLVDWSPDGKWILFTTDSGLWRIAASGGEAEQLTKGEAFTPRWSPDGKDIYFVRQTQSNNIWRLTVDSRQEHAVTALNGLRRGLLGSVGMAVDGQYLYFTWEESVGDIWVADIGRP